MIAQPLAIVGGEAPPTGTIVSEKLANQRIDRTLRRGAERLPLLVATLALALGAAGCTEDGARVLPFAQPTFELRVGETVDITVALNKPAEKTATIDVSSEFDGVEIAPKVLELAKGKRAGTVRITGRKSSRGVFQPVRFDLRGTQTGNTLLVLVANNIDPTDGSVTDSGALDGSLPDGPLPDGPKPDAAVSDGPKPDAAKPDAAKPDAAQPDAAQPDAAQPDAAQPDAGASSDGGADA